MTNMPLAQLSVSPGWVGSAPGQIARSGELRMRVFVASARRLGPRERPATELRAEGPVTVLSEEARHAHLVQEYLRTNRRDGASLVLSQLMGFVGERAERVAGDIAVDMISSAVRSCGEHRLAAFVEGPAHHRYVDRIAYLRLSRKPTIAFVAFDMAHIVTSLIRWGLGGFNVDAYTMLRMPTDQLIVKGPFPDYRSAATIRTFFLKLAQPSDVPYMPLRVDLFCPGDDERLVNAKVDLVSEVLQSDHESAPLRLASREPGYEPWTRLPLTLVVAHRRRADYLAELRETGEWNGE